MTALTASRTQAFQWRPFFQKYGLALSFLTLCLGLTLASDRFLTADNLINILRQSAVNGIIAVGMMLVILTRGIDLSVGSTLAFSTIIATDLLRQGVSPILAILAAIVAGVLVGAINGLLVSRAHIPPFIATLGMMTLVRGLAFSYTEGQPITGLPEAFRWLGTGSIGPIPAPVIVMALVFLAGFILLDYTPFGRHIFAYGDNAKAAMMTGLPTRRIVLFVYIAAGALSALAGVVLIGRLNSAAPSTGAGYEFDAIAAVVVGGTSFDGGEGSIWGTLLGVLLIAVLNNGLNLLNVPSPVQDVVKGAVIALALLLYKAIR